MDKLRQKIPISVTILAFNEEKQIADAIRSVQWSEEILVVDSGSTDKTVEIAEKAGAKVVRHPWEGYGKQKNKAQSLAKFDWILNLDADEKVSDFLAEEIQTTLEKVWSENQTIRGFSFPRKTYYLGHWIRYGGWYPNQLIRLSDRRYSAWSEPHVHEKLIVRGEVIPLKSHLDHFAFSSIEDQVLTNLRFSLLGAFDLRSKGFAPDKLKLLAKPIGKFLETYILKKGCLDGLPGFIISVNAAYSMFLKQAFLLEPQIKKGKRDYHEHPNHRQ